MNSPGYSQTPANPADVRIARTMTRIVIPYRLPSLNALFAMQHWQRIKEKKKAQANFESTLRGAAAGKSTPTMSFQSTCSTASAALDSYLTTMQTLSNSRSRKPRSKQSRSAR